MHISISSINYTIRSTCRCTSDLLTEGHSTSTPTQVVQLASTMKPTGHAACVAVDIMVAAHSKAAQNTHTADHYRNRFIKDKL